jgi:predicted MFS family arabinose efflux permease
MTTTNASSRQRFPETSTRSPESGAAAAPESREISQRLVLLLAVACGAAVANLYYIQPLLNKVGNVFGVSDTTAGLLVTASQVGYVLGLALLVPLGDLLERRRLITVVLIGAGVAAALCAVAPWFGVLAFALVAVGALSVVAMIVVPLAATLAGEQQRGQVVGTVMSGVLIGILASRTLSGLIAELGGWRLVFVVAAVAMFALALLLRFALPVVEPTERLRYRELLRSVLTLIREEPVLRQRMALGALTMGGFSILWTSIAFMLGRAPYHYNEGVIGLFGLAGLAGAMIAPVSGRLADRGHGRVVLGGALFVTLASWLLLGLGGTSLVALIAGLVVFDLGIQATHINNQSTIYALRADARSRLTTAYMVAFFGGGVLGSLLSATVYGAAGWTATCVLGAVTTFVGVLGWAATQSRRTDRTANATARS